MKWPEASRVIPTASNAITITVKDSNSNIVASGLIAKPATAWTSSLINPGSYTVVASAVPNTDGSGVVQASGTVAATVVEGQTTNSSLTMGATVSSVVISSPKTSLAVGDSVQLSVDCRDASGATVLVAPGTLKWASSNTAAATISASGLATGVGFGTTALTATFDEVESELGQSTIASNSVMMPIYSMGIDNILVGVYLGGYSSNLPLDGDSAWGYLINENIVQSDIFCKSYASGNSVKIDANLAVSQNAMFAFSVKLVLTQTVQCQYSWRGANAHWGNVNGWFQNCRFRINGTSYNTFQFAGRGADGTISLGPGVHYIDLMNASTGPNNAPATFTVTLTQ